MRIINKSAKHLIHLSHTIRNNILWFYLIFLLIGSILFFVGGPDYYSSRSLINLWNTGHILYFFLFAKVLLQWRLIARLNVISRWLINFSIAFLTGVTVELLQYGTDRTPDTGDIFRDLSGTILALVFAPSEKTSSTRNRQKYLQVLAIILLLFLLWPLIRSLIDEAVARHQFPLLSNFETTFEIDRWSGGSRLSIVSVPSISTSRVLKIELTTARYSGASLKYLEGDWGTAKKLTLSFYNPNTSSLILTVRIHDAQHTDGYEEYTDRYNYNFQLLPGWNPIEIDLDKVKQSPLSRDMDMSSIRGIGFYTVSLSKPRVIYLDKVWLTE